MDIILLERVAKLGQMGEVVSVKEGYARNYLLPQGKALRVNAANMARFEAEKAQKLQRIQTKLEMPTHSSMISVFLSGEFSPSSFQQQSELEQLSASRETPPEVAPAAPQNLRLHTVATPR